MLGGESPLLNKLRRNVRLTIAGFSPGKQAAKEQVPGEGSKDATEPNSPLKAVESPKPVVTRQAMHVASLQHRMGIVAMTNLITLNLSKDAKKRKEVLFSRKSNAADKLDKDIINIVYKILKSPIHSRGQADNEVVASYLETIDNIREVRSKISTENMLFLAQNCRLIEYKEYDIVVKYGDASSSVYYVLDGEIGVTTVNHSKYTKEHFSANMLSTIKQNTFFGEAGVLAKAQRTANCVALIPSKLLVMDGRAYIESVGREIKLLKQLKVSFLSRIVLLDGWDYPKIAAFHDSIGKNKIYPPYGSEIFKEREHLGSIFFVVRGQLEICVYPPPHFPKKEEIPLNLRTELMMKPKPRGAACRLLVLNEASFFGDENNPELNPGMHYIVRVISHSCELYWIKRTTLMMNVQNNPKQKEIIDIHLATRQNYLRNQMLEVLSKKIDTHEGNKKIAPGFEMWAKVLFGKRKENQQCDDSNAESIESDSNRSTDRDKKIAKNEEIAAFKEKYLRDYKSITNHEIAPVLAETDYEQSSTDTAPKNIIPESSYPIRSVETKTSQYSVGKEVLMTESRDEFFFKDSYSSQPNITKSNVFKLKKVPISQLAQLSTRDIRRHSNSSVESKLRSTRNLADSKSRKEDWAVSLGYIPKRADFMLSTSSSKDIKKPAAGTTGNTSQSRQLGLLQQCKRVLIKAKNDGGSSLGGGGLKGEMTLSDAVVANSVHPKTPALGSSSRLEMSTKLSLGRPSKPNLLDRLIDSKQAVRQLNLRRNPSLAESYLKTASPFQPFISAANTPGVRSHRKTFSLIGKTGIEVKPATHQQEPLTART